MLTMGVGLAVLVALAAPAALAQSGTPVVEAARQLTTNENATRLYNHPAVGIDPTDPANVVVATGDTRNGGCSLRVSRDGGLSWGESAAFVPEDRPFCIQRNFGRALDVAFASDGTMHVGLSGSSTETDLPHPNGPIDALAARSNNLGQTFDVATLVAAGIRDYELRDGSTEEAVEHNKNNSIAVDPNEPEVVYRGWRWTVRGVDQAPVPGWSLGCPDNCAPTRAHLAVSTDGGQSWGEPVDLGDAAGLDDVFGFDMPEIVVTSDGTVYAFASERPDRTDDAPDPRFFMFTSSDQGQSWDSTVIYEDVPETRQPEAAVDPGDDTLYLTWSEHGEDRDSPSNIMFMASSDGGSTWTDPISLTDEDEVANFNQYLPGISVAPNGRIDVAWYDYRNDPFWDPAQAADEDELHDAPEERFWDVYYRSSHDGGQSWSESLRVTDRLIDATVGVTFSNKDIRGPIGVASTNSAALFAWSDSRAGGVDHHVEDVYFTRVRHAADTATDGGGTAATSGLQWGAMGAAVALLVAGGLMFVVSRAAGAKAPRTKEAPA